MEQAQGMTMLEQMARAIRAARNPDVLEPCRAYWEPCPCRQQEIEDRRKSISHIKESE